MSRFPSSRASLLWFAACALRKLSASGAGFGWASERIPDIGGGSCGDSRRAQPDAHRRRGAMFPPEEGFEGNRDSPRPRTRRDAACLREEEKRLCAIASTCYPNGMRGCRTYAHRKQLAGLVVIVPQFFTLL